VENIDAYRSRSIHHPLIRDHRRRRGRRVCRR
jgi:hypothetical protein